jgi:BirA family biotin operon repressor/biotin-[acetyl-CoA-carboxylase] ligase
MQQRFNLLRLLADGRFHSGSALGAALGISRSAVWKHITVFASLGIDIHAVRGKGYQLSRQLELLSTERILHAISDDARSLIQEFDIVDEIDSTNDYLMHKALSGSISCAVCMAECQRAGRGRHGRSWFSPYARNIYLSMLWRFPAGPDALAGLGLAVGVGVIQALNEVGCDGLGLKWPNDLVWKQAKVGGILLEMTGASSSHCSVVIGIGINVDMSGCHSGILDQPWTDLHTILGRTISRNVVSGILIQHIQRVLADFKQSGLSLFLDEWRKYDVVTGRNVTVQLHDSEFHGVGHGVDDNGALVVKSDDQLHHFFSGEISLQVME